MPTNSTTKFSLNFFLFTLVLMFSINFFILTSFFQSIYFIFYLEKNQLITIFGFLLFLASSFWFLRSSEVQSSFFCLLFHPYCISYCLKVKNFIYSLSEKNSWLLFSLIHGYFCIFTLRFFFYWINIDSIPVDLIYSSLNLLKVAASPPFLLFFVLNYSPLQPELLNATVPHFKQINGNLLSKVTEYTNHKRNPRTAGVIYGVTFATGALVYNKQNIQANAREYAEELGVDLSRTPVFVSGNDASETDQIAENACALIGDLKLGTPPTLFLKDVKAVLHGEPTLREQVRIALSHYKKAEWQYQARQRQLRESADEIGMSPLARKSTSTPEDFSDVPSILENFFF